MAVGAGVAGGIALSVVPPAEFVDGPFHSQVTWSSTRAISPLRHPMWTLQGAGMRFYPGPAVVRQNASLSNRVVPGSCCGEDCEVSHAFAYALTSIWQFGFQRPFFLRSRAPAPRIRTRRVESIIELLSGEARILGIRG